VRRVRDGRGTSCERCHERDSSSRVLHGSRERGRPPLRIGIRRSTALLRAPAKVTKGAQKVPEARRSRPLRHRLITQPLAVKRKSLYAGLSHHSGGDKRPDRPGPSRKSDLVTSLCRLPHGSPTSSRPCAGSPTNPSRPGRLDGGHSLPGPPSRRPGPTSDGRDGPDHGAANSARPVTNAPPHCSKLARCLPNAQREDSHGAQPSQPPAPREQTSPRGVNPPEHARREVRWALDEPPAVREGRAHRTSLPARSHEVHATFPGRSHESPANREIWR
jgi:hypothetical protein